MTLIHSVQENIAKPTNEMALLELYDSSDNGVKRNKMEGTICTPYVVVY